MHMQTKGIEGSDRAVEVKTERGKKNILPVVPQCKMISGFGCLFVFHDLNVKILQSFVYTDDHMQYTKKKHLYLLLRE